MSDYTRPDLGTDKGIGDVPTFKDPDLTAGFQWVAGGYQLDPHTGRSVWVDGHWAGTGAGSGSGGGLPLPIGGGGSGTSGFIPGSIAGGTGGAGAGAGAVAGGGGAATAGGMGGYFNAAGQWINALLPIVNGYLSYKQQQKADEAAKKLQAQQQAQLAMLQPFGQSFLHNGQDNLNVVQNYLRSLAGGNRALAMQSVAPEINTLAGQQQGSVAAGHALYPRGGATASQNANNQTQFQGNVNNLLFGARRDALGQLGMLGNNQASLGLGAFGQGAGLTNSMLQYGLDARNQSFNQGSQIGQGIGQGLSGLLNYYQNRNTTRPAQTTPSTLNSTNYPNLYGNISFGNSNLGGPSSSQGTAATLGGGATASSNPYNNYLKPPY